MSGLLATAEPAIEVRDLVKDYKKLRAVDGIGFSVARGTNCALLGGNGAGKTTTLSMLLGLLLPTSGQIRILGIDIVKHRYAALPRMNFTSPYVDLPHRLTVGQNLDVYARLYGLRHRRRRLREVAEIFDLGALWKRLYGSLSAGQKTRVSLAKALLNEPEILLMDEPTASLDPASAERVRGWLSDYQRRTGATMLLASHNMFEVERLCSEVLMMKQGRIVDRGAPSRLIQRYGRENLEQVFIDIARDDAL